MRAFNTFVALVLFGLLSQALAQDAFVFLTTEDGFVQLSGTTLNQFPSANSVFLNAGPILCSVDNGIPAGTYYFQVLDSTGKLLSTDAVTARSFKVALNQGITSFTGTGHLTSTGPCGRISIQLAPFNAATGVYTVQVSTSSTFKTPVYTTIFTIATPAAQAGWLVSYYSSVQQNIDISPASRYNSPALQTFTNTLDFSTNWVIGAIGLKLDGAYFGATFTAFLTAPSAGSYTFTTVGREGVRLWIDGQKVIDNWKKTTTSVTSTGKITLSANSKYQFVLEFFNGINTPSLAVKWAIGTAAAVAIPATAFSASALPFGVANGNVIFSTLDNTHPQSTSKGTQSGPNSVPNGFALSTITAGNAAVLSYQWGCDCLVTATGATIAIASSNANKCGTATLKKTTVGGTDYWEVTPPTGSKLTYRILISGAVAANPSEYVVPTNTVTYNGNEYALLDGSPANAAGTGDCTGSQSFWKVPPGWVRASTNNDIAAVAISFGWSGATGLVVGTNIISTDNGGLLGTDGFEVDATGAFYRAKSKTFCTRVLISRSTTNANSWDAVPITNYLSCPDLTCEYATIDNADPLGSGTQFGCPPLAFKIPPGWSLAKRSSVFEQFISDRSITFGALCLTYADGTGYLTIADDSLTDRSSPCGQAQLRGVSLLSTTVLKKKQALKGAIWTSNFDGTIVNQNIYAAKTDVYLVGGPTGCQGQGLPDGDYYFQITDPPGKQLLSTDNLEDRRVTVKNGRVASTTGTHNTHVGVCGLNVQATPYLDSPNGEYKAWMTPVEAYDESKGSYSFGFGTASSKTDNFRVKTYNTTTVPQTGVYGVRDCSVPRRILIQRCPGDNPVTTAPPSVVDTTPCGTCTAWGDPHVTTFWGGKYNFFGLGHFTYAEPTTATKNWRIWGYLTKVQTASCNNEIWFAFNNENCSFTVPATSTKTNITFWRNGIKTNPNTESGKQIAVKKVSGADQYTVSMPNGITATITWDYWYINMITITFKVPNSLKGLTQGLCGTCGDKVFRLPGGVTTTDISGKENTFGAQWSVPNTPLVAFTPSYSATCSDATMNAKAQLLCSVYKTGTADFTNCVIDYCNTGSPSVVTGGTKYNGAANSICIKKTTTTTTTFCPVSTPAETNITTFVGRDYSTLDFISPSDRSAGSQLSFLSPPSGWKIAEDYPVRRALATCTRFGTNCLTFAEGTAVSHSLQKCGSSSTTNIQSAQDNCWKPLTTGRILVTSDDNIDFSEPVSTGAVQFTQVADTPIGANANSISFATPNGEKGEASINGVYNNDASFAIHVYAKTKTAPKKTLAGAFFGVQIDLKYTDGTSAANVASATFDFADTTWNDRWADVYPLKQVSNITVRLLVTGYSGAEVLFYGWNFVEASKWGTGNLVKDPTVQVADTTTSPWKQFVGGWTYSTEDNTVGDASGSIQLATSNGAKYSTVGDYGAIQVMKMTDYPQFNSKMTGLYFRGDAKVLSGVIDGTYGAGFSLYVDVFYTDGINASYGINAQFQRNATGWQSVEKYALIRNVPVNFIQIVALFRLSTGKAVFDNIYLTPLYCDFPYPPSDSPSTSYGDPHLVTLDGTPYDCQLLGDFILLQDESLTIMVRHSRAMFAAVNSITSFIYNDTVFTFERNKDIAPPLLTVNGQSVTLYPGGTVELPNGIGSITSAGSLSPPLKAIRYDIDLPTTGHKVTLTANVGDFKVQWLQVYPLLPSASLNMTRGLLGVYNQDKSDDFTNALGRVIPADSDALTLMREFAWTWKLASSPLVNKLSPDNDLEDEAIPDKVYSIQDFPPEQQLKAQQACAGIALYESCVLDILLSGDAGYVNGYNSLESILTSADASKPAQQSLNSDDSSSRYRETVLIVVFSILGGLLIVGIVVGVIMWNNSQKRGGARNSDGSLNKNLVG